MGVKNAIRDFDSASSRRPTEVCVADTRGRIIYSREPAGLFAKFDPKTEKIATIREVMTLRIAAFNCLLENIPDLKGAYSAPAPSQLKVSCHPRASQVVSLFWEKPQLYGIWQVRLTTSTNMIRAIDKDGIDTVFFYSGNPFDSIEEFQEAFGGTLSDGGIQYTRGAIEKVISETPARCKISYRDYLNARGGNFSGEEWSTHPVFFTACGREEGLMTAYVLAMHVLDIFSFYNAGFFSGWRPGEMKQNFGRPIALGLKGDAFYPPNNSTIDHAALILPK